MPRGAFEFHQDLDIGIHYLAKLCSRVWVELCLQAPAMATFNSCPSTRSPSTFLGERQLRRLVCSFWFILQSFSLTFDSNFFNCVSFICLEAYECLDDVESVFDLFGIMIFWRKESSCMQFLWELLNGDLVKDIHWFENCFSRFMDYSYQE